MINADAVGVNRLVGDIEISLFVPILCFCLGFGNSRLPWNRQSRGLRMRLTLSLSVLAFMFCICTLMFQDRATLIDLWLGSLVLYSLVYSISAVSCVLGVAWLIHWKLRPELWRDDSRN